jgi:PAS domain S-box-containing protein
MAPGDPFRTAYAGKYMLNNVSDTYPYLLNPLAVQSIVVALGVSLVGVYGLIRERGSRLSVAYFLLTLSMSVWLFAFSRMYSASDANLALWWAKAAYIGIGSIPAAVYNFCALVLQDYERLRKRVLTVWMLSALFITLILTTDIQFTSLYHYGWGYFPRSGITGIPFILFFLAVMVMALRSYVAGYRSVVRNSTQQRRSRILLIAFAIGSFAVLDFLATFGVAWYPSGYVAIFLFALISGYSIIRYRFMPITAAFAAHQIIDTMNDALIVIDPDGIVRLVNRAACILFQCREQDLVGKRPAAALGTNPAFVGTLESAIRSGAASNFEVEYQHREGPRRTLSLTVTSMRNPLGEPLATVCVVSDITARKRGEEERERLIAQLQVANEKLQEIDKMKSDFISIVSHELRTPLSTIKAFVELVVMKPGMPEQRRAKIMNTVNAETDRLSLIISDLLDLSRIESGSMTWRITSVSLEDIIRKTITNMRPLFEEKELRLTTAFSSPLANISGDRDRLIQVMTNILSNAIKFTPRGGAIDVSARQEADPRARIVVAVSDTGRGIPAGNLELIFEKFHRSGDQLTDITEGTGLGLAIARQIVEHHGGRIWAESTPGRGSVFTYTLPLKA